jgi:hypothetical protein
MVAQLHAAAAAALDTPEALAELLGCGDGAAPRAAAYRDAVRPHLPPAAAAFWDAHVDTIEAGVLRCGGAERLFAAMRAALPTLDPRELSAKPEAIATATEAAYTPEAMCANVPFLSAEGAPRFAPRFRALITEALQAGAAKCASGAGEMDWLMHLALTGEYSSAGDAATPLFLRRDVYDAAKRLGCGPERLRYHAGRVEDIAPCLAEASGRFDLIAVSNILTPDLAQSAATVARLKPALAPGGAILCRTQAETPGFAAEVFESNGLHVDSAVSARLLSRESWFMSSVYAAFLPGEPP